MRAPMTDREINMLLAGVAIGALAAIFLDPVRGPARRAKARDKAFAAAHRISERAARRALDVRQRAHGRIYETRHKHERVDDDTLIERVRAQLGKRASNIHQLAVSASNGVVAITGPVKPEDRAGIIDILRKTRGVVDVRIREGLVQMFAPHSKQPHPQA